LIIFFRYAKFSIKKAMELPLFLAYLVQCNFGRVLSVGRMAGAHKMKELSPSHQHSASAKKIKHKSA